MFPKLRLSILVLVLLLLTEACYRPMPPSQPARRPTTRPVPQQRPTATRLGWSIQAGAFSQIDNAVRLSESLNSRGLEATYFRDTDKLYKVRFGNFTTRDIARNRAESLRAQRVLEVYYLIAPESLAGALIGDSRAETGIRKSLITTAESYLGVPYRWGGTSAQTGFDCSGLSQSVYKLNGLSIPRTSREQYSKGRAVTKNNLRGGDLLFFSTSKGTNVSHVAIYIGDGIFIHAPSSGQVIRKDNLNSQVWSRQYIGAKSYL
ncbi:MAG: NlpC/P60 family protein [Holophagaceae bacterium]|nr:NlpC/P60 family protein [Holophagaceae bacterium]